LLRAEGEPPPGPLDVRSFQPSGRPGARLPHTWVTEKGRRGSLLDQVPLGRFLLLAGPDGDAWIDALASAGGVPIEGRKLDRASVPDLDGWLALAGIDRSGALLVRPDQHVAWRARSSAARPARELSRALRTILSRGSDRSDSVSVTNATRP
jgi:2,4-dichlorophenol 6-monooxygenase